MRHPTRCVASLAGAVTLLVGAPGLAAAGSATEAFPPPGPPVLYWPRAQAPQLENTGIWTAPPILVSGARAYRAGEFLYQDFLYDDHGAQELPDPADRRQNNQFSAPNGTYTYPSNRAYGENAADLVEVRVRPLADATALRFTLNTVIDPTLIGITVALGGAPGHTHPLPFGANAVAPAADVVTVHPSGGALVASVDALEGGSAAVAPSVAVDTVRRQIEVRVPHGDWDPGTGVVRLAAAVGLWDKAAGRYLLPASTSSAAVPGGAGSAAAPAAFFNVAFRGQEPQPTYGQQGVVDTGSDPKWWRDHDQGHALAAGDISPFAADVDFGRLAAGLTDDSGVPTTGSIDRILPSHFEPAQGVDYSGSCYSRAFRCEYQGELEPYDVYVPATAPPASGSGLTLLLHANAANYNEFATSTMQSQFGDRGTGTITLTTEARDPGGSYTGYAAADVFEAWAEVARLYHLDPSWRVISGYSLGGLGTYKLGEQWPDLFARAVAVVGSPGTPVPQAPESTELRSLRNLPIMVWDVLPVDELNPYSQANVAALQQLGYRYDYITMPGDHLSPAFNDQFAPAAEFLGTSRVDPDPSHVTYVYPPSALDGLDRPYGDYPGIGLTAGHAYWVADTRLRDQATSCNQGASSGCGGLGTVDAVSHGFGLADPPVLRPQTSAGALPPGKIFPTLPYTELQQTWGPPAAAPVADAIDLTLTNLSDVTIYPARAHIDCAAAVHVVSDGPAAVHLAGCNRTVLAGGAGGPSPEVPEAPAAVLLPLVGLAALAAGVEASRRRRLR